MTRKNYKEMKRKKITTVIIPINAHSDVNDPYAIPLVATIFHYEPVVGCVLNIPNSTAKIMYVTERETHMSRMAYSVRGALLEKSGVYKYTCSGMQSIGGHRFRKIMSVSLDLKFVLGTVTRTSDSGHSERTASEQRTPLPIVIVHLLPLNKGQVIIP